MFYHIENLTSIYFSKEFDYLKLVSSYFSVPSDYLLPFANINETEKETIYVGILEIIHPV